MGPSCLTAHVENKIYNAQNIVINIFFMKWFPVSAIMSTIFVILHTVYNIIWAIISTME